MSQTHEKRAPAGAAKRVIGWAERVDIPSWGVRGLRAKVDTGARTSALHVDNIVELGRDRVSFEVILDRRSPGRRVTVETQVVRRAFVRPSSGEGESRVFVRAAVRIGDIEREIELSLVGRERMVFRMLLGRSALASHFLVDVSRRYLLSSPRRVQPASKRRQAPGQATSNTKGRRPGKRTGRRSA